MSRRVATASPSDLTAKTLRSGWLLTTRVVDFPLTTAAKDEAKAEFARRGCIPGVLACVDGTLVAIRKPEGYSLADTASFMSRKGYYALNVMIVCNARLRILVVDPRFPGSCHDSWVWEHNPWQGPQPWPAPRIGPPAGCSPVLRPPAPVLLPYAALEKLCARLTF
nr:putative nuclease HARBI1 [Rhipicephalus microplus]